MTLGRDLGLTVPVVQAGMGGGIARHELAAAVSEAGGLGTIAVRGGEAIGAELHAARRLSGRPVAVNVLLPFADRGTWRAAAQADVVVTFWGRPRRRVPGTWLHQCGSVAEARAALAAGADGLVLQGSEAGGHVRGTTPALELLDAVRSTVGTGARLLVAGGIATAQDVRRVLDGGAAAAVVGTRFLLSDESRAHAGYKRRLLDAGRTIVTELFGAGWPRAPHRVVPNEATERWLGGDDRGPPALRLANGLLAPAAARMPDRLLSAVVRHQRPGTPLLTPVPPTDDGPASLVSAGPLYAGRTVARIDTLEPASVLVRRLTP